MQTYEQGSLWSLTPWSVNLLNLLFSFSIFKIVTPQCKCGRMSVGEFLKLGKRQIIHLEARFDVQKREGLRLGNKLCRRHNEWKTNVLKLNTAAQTLHSSEKYAIRYCRHFEIARISRQHGYLQVHHNIGHIVPLSQLQQPTGAQLQSTTHAFM